MFIEPTSYYVNVEIPPLNYCLFESLQCVKYVCKIKIKEFGDGRFPGFKNSLLSPVSPTSQVENLIARFVCVLKALNLSYTYDISHKKVSAKISHYKQVS